MAVPGAAPVMSSLTWLLRTGAKVSAVGDAPVVRHIHLLPARIVEAGIHGVRVGAGGVGNPVGVDQRELPILAEVRHPVLGGPRGQPGGGAGGLLAGRQHGGAKATAPSPAPAPRRIWRRDGPPACGGRAA